MNCFQLSILICIGLFCVQGCISGLPTKKKMIKQPYASISPLKIPSSLFGGIKKVLKFLEILKFDIHSIPLADYFFSC